MIVDGKAIAQSVYDEVRAAAAARAVPPHLTIFTCAPDFATQKYLALKQKKAQEVGISINVVEFPIAITTDEVVQSITQAQMQTEGIVVQLPLPEHIDTTAVINAIPVRYDVDGMHYDGTTATILSPVVGAIALICKQHDVLLAAQRVVVVGNGRLVGKPAALWAQKQGAEVTVVTKDTDPDAVTQAIATADVIISGAGTPHLITSEMIKTGVLLFDAGTSEDGGDLTGDIDPACAEHASLYTPVPGGIGPITIAVLLRNLLTLSER